MPLGGRRLLVLLPLSSLLLVGGLIDVFAEGLDGVRSYPVIGHVFVESVQLLIVDYLSYSLRIAVVVFHVVFFVLVVPEQKAAR